MNIYKKFIAGGIASIILVSSVFAYDLTDKERTKGDTITSKILMIINKKPEEKREKLTKSVITQLEGLQERARKNEKMAALIGYVVEKMKSGNGEVVNSRYPGCNKDDIALDNGQIWSACDVGSTIAGEQGEKFAWGSMTGYKDLSTPNKVGPANDWSETYPQGPCRNGYHVPSKGEVERAKVSSLDKNPKDDILGIGKDKFYWTTVPGMYNSAYFFENLYNRNTGEINTFYLGWSENYSLMSGIYSHYLFIRCIKD